MDKDVFKILKWSIMCKNTQHWIPVAAILKIKRRQQNGKWVFETWCIVLNKFNNFKPKLTDKIYHIIKVFLNTNHYQMPFFILLFLTLLKDSSTFYLLVFIQIFAILRIIHLTKMLIWYAFLQQIKPIFETNFIYESKSYLPFIHFLYAFSYSQLYKMSYSLKN